jgi:hypothetical protein
MSGDQSTLKLQGACVRVRRPTSLMSRPSCFSQVGIAVQTRPRGRPEENDSSATESSRQLPATVRRLCQVLSLRSAPADTARSITDASGAASATSRNRGRVED